MSSDRYGHDALTTSHRSRQPVSCQVPAEPGLVVEEVMTGWVGAIMRVEKSGGLRVAVLEDRKGRTRTFPLGPGFWIDGVPVELTVPAPVVPVAPLSVSGAVRAPETRARVARDSRIWVEGRHDAELVEKVWGDDLRAEAVVVEMIDGVDNLATELDLFDPKPGRRVGVLVDHLVAGSKEQRIADTVHQKYGAHVLVVGHPYVDVWQSVQPNRLGIKSWPVIPRETEWKIGVLQALGWPHTGQADVAAGWKRILGTVRTYQDLEPSLLGRVEELIDFVTE